MSGARRRFWLSFRRWLAAQVPARRLGAFRAVVCLIVLYDVMLWRTAVFTDAAAVSAGTQTRPWTPIYLFQLLGIEPIGTETANVLFVVLLVSLLLGVLGVCSRVAVAIACVAFYLWAGFPYSFGKPHHDKVALALTMAALPFARIGAGFSIDALWRRRWPRPAAREPERSVAGTPIRFAQLTLALGYCGAGLAKVVLGGPQWFNGYTLQGIMLGHQGYLSRVVGDSPLLCQLQSVGVVSVQVLFPVVLVWPAARWFFLPAALSFHLMTWMTMDTGPYMSVWLMLWAFVPLERVPRAVLRGLRGGAVRAAGTALGCAALGALIGYVASTTISPWLVIAFALLVVGAFAGWAARQDRDVGVPAR